MDLSGVSAEPYRNLPISFGFGTESKSCVDTPSIPNPASVVQHQPIWNWMYQNLGESNGLATEVDKHFESFQNFYDVARDMSNIFVRNLKASPALLSYQGTKLSTAEVNALVPMPLPLNGLEIANVSYALCRCLGGSQSQGLFAYKEVLKLMMGQDGVSYIKSHDQATAKRVGLSANNALSRDEFMHRRAADCSEAMRYRIAINMASQALNDDRKYTMLHHAKNMVKSYFKTNIEVIHNLRHAPTDPRNVPVIDDELNTVDKVNHEVAPLSIKHIPVRLSLTTLQRPTWGSSSSHGIGPAELAGQFLKKIEVLDQEMSHNSSHGDNNKNENSDAARAKQVDRIVVKAYGSLGATGKPHNLHLNVICALAGIQSNDLNSSYGHLLAEWEKTGVVKLANGRSVKLVFEWIAEKELSLPNAPESQHLPNGITFNAFNQQGDSLAEVKGYSIGGGFTLTMEDVLQSRDKHPTNPETLQFNTPLEGDLSADGASKKTSLAFHSASSLIKAMRAAKTNRLTEFWLAYENAQYGIKRDALLAHAKKLAQLMINNTKYAALAPKSISLIDHQLQAPILARANALQDALPNKSTIKNRLYSLSAQAASGSMAVASTAGCVHWGSALQVPLSPTIGSAGVMPGVFIPFLMQRTGMDVMSHSTEALMDKLGDEALLDFFAGSTVGLVITKQQSSHAAAAHGCMGEVGNSSIAGVMAYLNGMLPEPDSTHIMASDNHMTCSDYNKAGSDDCFERLNFEKVNKVLQAGQHVMRFYDGLTCTPAEGRVGSPCNVRNEQSFSPIMTSALAVLNEETPASIGGLRQIADNFDQGAYEQDIIGKNMSTALRETDKEKVMTGTGDGMVSDIEDLGGLRSAMKFSVLNKRLTSEFNSLLRHRLEKV